MKIKVEEKERIDKYISSVIQDKSRSEIQKLIKLGFIKVNDEVVKPNYKLNIGDEITIDDLELPKPEILPENIDINIIYEDKDIAVVEKDVDLIVHPAPGQYSNTLVNGLLYHIDNLSDKGEYYRPGIVHRLDKDTSGLMVIAKTNESYDFLVEQFKQRSPKRYYICVVKGFLKEEDGEINLPIGRDPNDRTKMKVIDQNSKEAITRYKVLKRTEEYSVIEAELITGRMHQIRVHFSHLGHPIIGDEKYSGKKENLKNYLLHAYKIGFIHPRKNTYLELSSKLPNRFNKYIK